MASDSALEDGVQSLSLDNAAPRRAGEADLPTLSSPSGLTVQELAPREGAVGKRPSPHFFPPLWLGRRTACVEVLKREGIRSVVDLGCGLGALLQILSSPANHLDDFPEIYPPSPVSESPSASYAPSPRARKLELLRSVPRNRPEQNELHLRRLVGLDVRADSLRNAIEVSSPPVEKEVNESSWGSTERERWEELTVEIYEGALEVFNEALEGVEAMVATEVIEHLSPQALAKFSSVILGVYQPRIVVVTTPNHEFNPYFVPSSSVDESLHRFPDPTHRTNRVFRDDDHQFEWTQAEFQSWAKEAAAANDYSVSFSGVGSLSHYFGFGQPIPFPPPSLDAHPALSDSPTSLALPSDPTHFFATQIAVFRLRYPNESERSPRSHRPTPLPFFSPTSTPNSVLPPTGSPPLGTPPQSPSTPRSTSIPHTLLKTHVHRAHPSASSPAPGTEILAALAKLFRDEFGSPRVSLREIWGRREVRILCGGAIGEVVEAVVEDESGKWDLEVDQSRNGDAALGIAWRGWVEREKGVERGEEEEGSGGEEESEGVVGSEGEGDEEEDRMWGASGGRRNDW